MVSFSNHPDHRSKEELLKQFRVESLTDAARQAISEDGMSALTIERVAELANVSKGTIYLYFKNKDELVRATVASTIELILHEVGKAASLEADFPGKLRALVSAQFQLVQANQTFFRSIISDPPARIPSPKGVPDEVICSHLNYVKFITGLLDEGKASGHVRPDIHSDQCAFFIAHLVQAAGVRRLLGIESVPMGAPEEIESLLELLIHGIGRPGA